LVAKIMGDGLLCFQISNEDDQFHAMAQFRDASYIFECVFQGVSQVCRGNKELKIALIRNWISNSLRRD
jgi:hypothetical protein